ncbi:MAG TPA: BrnT family toxin [Candidatus Binatia bacterium]|nr:BrnT family toxin [Candidatus Binatia bacterium]
MNPAESPEFDGFSRDSDKSDRCYRERGFDFEYAAGIFEGDFVEWEDFRREYGEQRFVTVGQVADRILVVVWTARENFRRIIPPRPASRSERKKFYAARQTHQSRNP